MTAYVLRLPLEAAKDAPPIEVQMWAQWPLTPEHWDRMMLILEAMRPGLVVDPYDQFCRFLSTVLATS
jgi:hypothetical protein